MFRDLILSAVGVLLRIDFVVVRAGEYLAHLA
jgi:hypothetical protein